METETPTRNGHGAWNARLRWLSAGLCLALIWGAAQGAVPGFGAPPPLDFMRCEIEVGGKITDVTSEDLDNDGRKDLLVIRGREIQVYFQDETGFQGKPHQRWRFDRRAVLFDTVDMEGDGPREILYLAADGVYTYSLTGRRYRLVRQRRKELETLTRRPSNSEIRRKDLCRDLDGDGREDLVIPEASGLGIYLNTGGEFGERRSIFVPPSATVNPGSNQLSSQLNAIYWFSNPNVIDFDQDGKKDLLVPVDDTLKVFKQAKEGGFSVKSDASVKVPHQKLLAAGQRPDFDLDLTLPLMLPDLNTDGRVDMVSTHIGQGLTRVFMGSDKGIEAFKTPSQTIRAKGVSFYSFTVDLNGDGLLDLVIPRTDKIGIWYLLKVLVTRSVTMDVLCFYQRKGEAQPYPRDPDFVGEIEIPVLIRSTGDKFKLGTNFVASISADFNKDGRLDVLYRTDDDALGIFYGRDGRKGFPQDPSAKVKIKDVSDYRFMLADVPDLNNDGVSDIILRYYSWDRKADRLTVLISKR